MGGLNVIKRSEDITKEELKQKFPGKKNTITDEVVQFLNATMQDPDFDNTTFLSQLVEYQGLMLDNSTSITEFINAMKFCAYLEVEQSVVEAYKRARANDTFVQERLTARSGTKLYNELTMAASRYRKNKLVRQILTQSDMPLHLMFQGSRYRAIVVLSREMEEAARSQDRICAAEKLLMHLKPPESKIELEIGMNKESMDLQSNLFNKMTEVAQMQHERLTKGEKIDAVQRVEIVTEVVGQDSNEA